MGPRLKPLMEAASVMITGVTVVDVDMAVHMVEREYEAG